MNDLRVPAGIPAGGQFASHDRAESDVELTPAYDERSAARADSAMREFDAPTGTPEDNSYALHAALSDLRHWAAKNGVDFAAALASSRDNYTSETGQTDTALTDFHVGQLSDGDVSSLRSAIDDRLGVVGPTFEKEHIRYRLFEAQDAFDIDTDRIAAAAAAAGGNDALVDRLVTTDAWGVLDEWSDWHSRQLTETLDDALTEIEQGHR